MSKKDKKRTIHNEKGPYFENLDIHKGDFVNGDKIDRSIHTRDVANSVLNTGDGAVISNNPQTIDISKEKIQHLLDDMRTALQAAPVDDDVKEIVQADIQTMAKQLEQPEPKKAILLPKAKAILGTITAVAAAYEVWPTIVEMGQRLVEWITMLFGG